MVGYASFERHTTTATSLPRAGENLDNVQILAEAIGGCKNELATLSQSGGKLQLCQNEEELGRARIKW